MSKCIEKTIVHSRPIVYKFESQFQNAITNKKNTTKKMIQNEIKHTKNYES